MKKRRKYDRPIKKLNKKKKPRTKRTKLADVPKKVDYGFIEKLYANGLLDPQVAASLGLSESTLNRYKHALGLMTVIKGAREAWKKKSVLTATQSLFRNVTGYNYAEVTMEPVLSMRQVDGVKEKVMMVQELQITKVLTKHIQGDVGAQLEWLYNNDAENWKRKIDTGNSDFKYPPIFVVPAHSGNVVRLPVAAVSSNA